MVLNVLDRALHSQAQVCTRNMLLAQLLPRFPGGATKGVHGSWPRACHSPRLHTSHAGATLCTPGRSPISAAVAVYPILFFLTMFRDCCNHVA